MPARESALVKRVKKYIRDNGGYVVKTCPPMEAGTPDLLVCWKGRFVGIELKAGVNQPSKMQLHRIEQINCAGGIAFSCNNMEHVVYQLGMLSEVSAC